ncbi:hypothetical protein [Hydrogenimonas sp.]
MKKGEGRTAYAEVLNRGIVKSHIRFVKRNGVSLALLCFALKLPEPKEEAFERAVMTLQDLTDFSALLLCEQGMLFTFLKDLHLHRAVQVAKNIQETLLKDTGITIQHAALTIVDEEDDYDTLMARMERYMEQARQFGEGKICYGTAKYDFCTKGGEEEIFVNFFSDQEKVTLYNFYNGMPLSEEVRVLGYADGLLRLKTSLAKAAFLKNEPFTFLKHPLLPDTLKADIVNAMPNRAEVILTNLHFIDKSPVDRENIRVMPDEPIEVTIECADGTELYGTIHSLAVNSIAIKLKTPKEADRCFSGSETHVMLSFDLKEQQQRKVHVRISAVLFNREQDQVVFAIYPNHFFKQKIEGYIALQQSRLITIMQKMVLNFYQG